jgi:hypothetical protein
VSSILDALEKLESRRTPGATPEPPRRTRRRLVPLLAGAALAAFATGIAFTAVLLRPAEEEPVVVAPRPAAPEPPQAAEAAPAAVTNPPPAAPPRAAEQPWGEVVSPPAPRGFSANPAPAREPVARSAPPPRERRDATELAAAPPPAAPPPVAKRPDGAPEVQVSFLVYSSVPTRRTVALKVDGGGLVTLHEGESAGGLSVREILPDGVDLDWQGQTYTVHARD